MNRLYDHDHRRGGSGSRPARVAAGVALLLCAGTVAGPVVHAEEGDSTDPTFVNLRVAFPAKLRLASKLDGTVRAYSTANGPQTSTYSGTARLGLDRSGPGPKLRSTVAEVSLEGTVTDVRDLGVRLTSAQLKALRAAARKARTRTVVLNVVLRGTTEGQAGTSKVNASFRLRSR